MVRRRTRNRKPMDYRIGNIQVEALNPPSKQDFRMFVNFVLISFIKAIRKHKN